MLLFIFLFRNFICLWQWHAVSYWSTVLTIIEENLFSIESLCLWLESVYEENLFSIESLCLWLESVYAENLFSIESLCLRLESEYDTLIPFLTKRNAFAWLNSFFYRIRKCINLLVLVYYCNVFFFKYYIRHTHVFDILNISLNISNATLSIF